MAQASDYTTLLTPQHATRPRFRALVAAVAQCFADQQNVLQSLPGVFDLDAAQGAQLDATGQWIGANRQVATPIAGAYFALDSGARAAGPANLALPLQAYARGAAGGDLTLLPGTALDGSDAITGNGGTFVSPLLSVRPGQTYTIGGYVDATLGVAKAPGSGNYYNQMGWVVTDVTLQIWYGFALQTVGQRGWVYGQAVIPGSVTQVRVHSTTAGCDLGGLVSFSNPTLLQSGDTANLAPPIATGNYYFSLPAKASITANTAPDGSNSFAIGQGYARIDSLPVVPGATYRYSGYIDASAASSQIAWTVESPAVGATYYLLLWQQPGMKGRLSGTFTVPAGVTQIALAATNVNNTATGLFSSPLLVQLTGVPGLGFDQGVWQRPGDATTGIVSLDDTTYRQLLRAKISANAWPGTAAAAFASLASILSGSGSYLLLQDNGDMSMTLGVSGQIPSALFLALLARGVAALKPSGVRLALTLVASSNNTALFSLDGQSVYVSGFDTGSWGTAQ